MRLFERLHDFRNRLISRREFRNSIQNSKVFHKFAGKSSERLFALCTGFVHSQVLDAFLTLDLEKHLENGARGLAELAQLTELPAERLDRFLQAAVALDLVERRANDRFALGAAGAALLDNDGLRDLIIHHRRLYEDLADPVALIAGSGESSRLSRYWPYAGSNAPASVSRDAVTPYSRTMALSQQMVAASVVADPVFRSSHRVLDIGGGDATFAIELARRWPQLRVTVVDLPAVTDLARENIERAGLSDRISATGLDFLRESLPTGHDCATLIRIVHDHDDDAVKTILAAARSALEPEGTLLIAEPMADETPAGRLVGAYFSIYLLAMGQGRPRSPDALQSALCSAGFSRVQRRTARTRIVSQVVVAEVSG